MSGQNREEGRDPLAITSFIPEETLEQLPAFIFADTRGNQASMIQLRHLQQVNQAAGGASFGVGTTENYSAEPDMDDGAGAHGARFLRHVKIAIVESPIAHGALGLSDRQDFGVSGRVLQGFNLVPRSGDDFAFGHHNGADRNLLRGLGFSRLAQRFAHEISVARKIQHFRDA